MLNLDLLLAQRVEERVAGELPALLGVDDLRLGMAIYGGPLRHPGDPPERNNGTNSDRAARKHRGTLRTQRAEGVELCMPNHRAARCS